MSKSQKIILAIVGILLIAGLAVFVLSSKPTEQSDRDQTNSTQSNSSANEIAPPEEFNKNLYSIDEPGSPWWVVNKKRPLPGGYVPPDLAVPSVRLRLDRSAPQMPLSMIAIPALEEMFNAAKQDGVELVFGSGYRSEALQRQFYNQYVAQDGQAEADRYSARPGTSEHQTGLTFDATAANGACHLVVCFEDTPEGKWLRENAHIYGFIIRYVEGKEGITGYQYEPWHLRYVGKELAMEMKRTGIQTLEEFFNLPAAPSY